MNKSVSAILIAALIMGGFLASAFVVAAPSSDYRTEHGVLFSDSYYLYPFASHSLDIGFSKYGEMIDSNNNVGLQYPGFDEVGTYDQRLGTSRDPFANEIVSKALWVNGWLLNATYRNKLYMLPDNPNKAFRNVWAFALFADGQAWGGDWNEYMTNPTLNTGGRQTNHYAWTDDMAILYDGPRNFVAMMVTHINDTEAGASWSLCDVVITVVFNKVTKEVMLYKDVKLKLETKYLDGLVDVQFGDRGEWDLGPPTGARQIKSYAHIYYEYNDTSYDENWNTAKNLKHDVQDTFFGSNQITQANIPFPNATGGTWWFGFMLTCPTCYNPYVDNTDHVWVNAAYQLPLAPVPYIIIKLAIQRNTPTDPFDPEPNPTSSSSWWVLFPHALGSSDKVTVFYKNYIKGTHPDSDLTNGHFPYNVTDMDGNPHEYTLAQIISADTTPITSGPKIPGTVVGFAAFWPVLSWFTPDGWGQRLTSIIGTKASDMAKNPDIPFLIGQWDFTLDISQEFRGVEVYGIVDYHDAKDPNMDAPYKGTVVDREVQYQLAQIFKPWDLTSAINKDTTRWVDFTLNPVGSSTFVLSHNPVMPIPDNQWDQYCTFSERVIDLTTGKALRRYYTDSLNHWKWDYNLTWNNMGVGTISGLNSTHQYKILYSTTTYDTIYPHLGAGDNDWGYETCSMNGTLGGNYYNQTTFPSSPGMTFLNTTQNINDAGTFIDKLNATISLMMNASFATQLCNTTVLRQTTGNGTLQLQGDLVFNDTELKVFKENVASGTLAELGGNWNTWQASVANQTDNAFINLTKVGLYWTITPPCTTDQDGAKRLLDLHIDYAKVDLGYTISITYWRNATYWYWHLDWDFDLDATITWHIPGTYEWTILGRDAATSDSLGATLDTAALKNKQVEIGNAGEDMMYQEWGMPTIPWVMNCFGTLPGTRTDYKWQQTIQDPSWPGMRSALVDDWCTRWPVSSSDILSVGGPLANMMSYYFNDFTDAFYGLNIDWLGEDFTPFYPNSPMPWAGRIVALSCWSRNAYQDTATLGYATIGTYKDLNGTVGLLIWGNGPRDTYYASKFFHDEIVYELQVFPPHVTSVIIEINYTDSKHPTFTMKEVLGTISEREIDAVYDPAQSDDLHVMQPGQPERPVPYWYPETSPTKGGIHVDP